MKPSLRLLTPLVLVILTLFLWRWTHPILSDEQQIRAALDGIEAQASHKNSGGITSYLTKDFEMNGLKRKELTQNLTGGLFNYRVVTLKISRVQVQVSGNTATTRGHYYLGLKTEFSSPEQPFSNDFSLKWKREDGQWKISSADDNTLPPGLIGG